MNTTTIEAITHQDDGLLKLQEVAKMLRIHRATLYEWINKQQFPRPVQIRGRNFYRVGTVMHWLNTYAPETRFDRLIVKH